MTNTIPAAYLSTFHVDGREIWQVIYRGGPICAETDETGARRTWDSWRNQGAGSVSAKEFPAVAPIYDGDAGHWR